MTGGGATGGKMLLIKEDGALWWSSVRRTFLTLLSSLPMFRQPAPPNRGASPWAHHHPASFFKYHSSSTSSSHADFSAFSQLLPGIIDQHHHHRRRRCLDSSGMFSPLCFSAKCPAISGSGRLFFFGCMRAGLIHAPVGLKAKSRSDTLSYQKITALHTPAKALRGGCTVLLALTIAPLILQKKKTKTNLVAHFKSCVMLHTDEWRETSFPTDPGTVITIHLLPNEELRSCLHHYKTLYYAVRMQRMDQCQQESMT